MLKSASCRAKVSGCADLFFGSFFAAFHSAAAATSSGNAFTSKSVRERGN